MSNTAVAREEYDLEMVAALFRADAEKPEATFTNIVDMMDWLEASVNCCSGRPDGTLETARAM